MGSQNYDRFLPVVSSADRDLAQFLMTERCKLDDNSANTSAYQKCLRNCVFQGRTRVFDFKRKPEGNCYDPSLAALVKRQRQIPRSAEMVLTAPDIWNNYNLNLLEWGSENNVAIALGNTVYLWNASNQSTTEFVNVDRLVTSISWSADGQRLAMGLDDADVHLLDVTSCKLLRTMGGVHQSKVRSLAWHNNILATAGKEIVEYDMRVKNHVAHILRGNCHRVPAVKWSCSGRHLASGGTGGLVHIWDTSMGSNSNCLHRFNNTVGSAKALSWCPVKSHLLASSGGGSSNSIVFWNTLTAELVNTLDTGSKVSEIIWSQNGQEFLTSHGSPGNPLIVWRYQPMSKITNLMGHDSRVLFMSQSPDGSSVASVEAMEPVEKCLIWKDILPKQAPETTANVRPFGGSYDIRHLIL